MRKILRRTVMFLLAAVFLVSGGMLCMELLQYRQGAETYAEAETLAGLPDFSQMRTPSPDASDELAAASSDAETPVYVDPYADALRSMDFAALREANPEVLGWILIPGTVISYPLVRHADNSYYLKHTWRCAASAVGSIFMECRNAPDFSDFNTIIYGHNMNNGSMFGALKKYQSAAYWRAHPDIYVTDDAGIRKYEVFAAYEVSTAGDTYRLGFSSEDGKQAFLDFCMEQSVLETGVTPTVYDRILTLSTCTGHGHATRWVVQARLPGTVPASSAEAAPEEGAPAPAAETAPEESTPAPGAEAAAEESTPASSAEAAAEESTPASSAEAAAEESAPAPDAGTEIPPAAEDAVKTDDKAGTDR